MEKGNKEEVWKTAYSLWSGFPMDLFVVKKEEENAIVNEANRYGMTLYEKEMLELNRECYFFIFDILQFLKICYKSEKRGSVKKLL